jgi:hypothetical protein
MREAALLRRANARSITGLTGVIDWTDEVVISCPVPLLVAADVGVHRVPVPG